MRPGNFPKGFAATCAIVAVFFLATIRPNAADVAGKVQGANSPIVGSTVTLYAASAGAPAQLGQASTDDKGNFKLKVPNTSGNTVLYVVARGGTSKAPAAQVANNAIALLAVLGNTPPKTVTVNEFVSPNEGVPSSVTTVTNERVTTDCWKPGVHVIMPFASMAAPVGASVSV